MHEVLVDRLGGLSLSRKNVVRLTDRPDMALDVYRGRKNNKTELFLLSSMFYTHLNTYVLWNCVTLNSWLEEDLWVHAAGEISGWCWLIMVSNRH